MRFGKEAALLVVDMQNDFLPGGALAVAGGNEIIAPINQFAERFDNVILTQDWHPKSHVSFASSHSGRSVFDTIELPYGPQILWPDHCVQGTKGAELATDLYIPTAHMIIRKGYHPHTDSYSAFSEADRETKTGLAGYLLERGIKTLFCAGLATDFCVSWTALDAHAAGFSVSIIENACRAINTGGSLSQARQQWQDRGIKTITVD